MVIDEIVIYYFLLSYLAFLFMTWKSGTLVFLQQHNPHAHHHTKMGNVYKNLLLLLAFKNLLPFLPPLIFFLRKIFHEPKHGIVADPLLEGESADSISKSEKVRHFF